jgi:hypothetical protein
MAENEDLKKQAARIAKHCLEEKAWARALSNAKSLKDPVKPELSHKIAHEG